MSSAVPGYPPGAVPAPHAEAAAAAKPDEEIRLYGHSDLFYWWPVWAVAFLMAGLTFLDGHLMAVVPQGTEVRQVQTAPGSEKTQEALVVPENKSVPPATATSPDAQPKLRVAATNAYGVVFAGVLILVIAITNLTLRGLASVIVIALLVIAGLTIALLGWWDKILMWLGGVDVRMNAGGYLAIGIPVLVMWLFATFIYDHYTYIIVARGQIRIRREIGDGEVAVDASGLVLEKKRDDLFRHWLLGLGSGDLHVKTGGPSNLDFNLHNVLFIGSKLDRVQNLIREKETSPQIAGA
ncbi:hypothetical protein GobsT_68970 [Gemmata obscuriglobus]|uniref:Uncharacterized protein n=1 Tax=Gemmata obscuriglobus TaxID=114 RepID=A0A2Z3HC44_9BACT|nr:hypothetical protein [Gemmata obscuriglobus]AWM41972.1 hypothetical protein C1280_36585 [Gemmata obscuriglobus]QEG32047.1 hypothetical protein GobsT_68970 [Gemmata obscuriglobus]VTS11397.1 Uncharacterized protein OS=Singulisphaera acidiphila (strain ATCC BAA-1392 / DSM 18658 / VKM B-2454 / MOB10) GN=Sinac_0896 PE=4 SV=1 [Gemmata obscuriglobus UQM 2246]